MTILGPTRRVNHLQAIFNPNALHDPVDVVLYGLLGKVKGGCDFLICQPLTYEGNYLLLPACQPEFEFNPRAWNTYLLPRKGTKKMGAKPGRADGLSLGHRAHRRDDFRSGGIL